MLKYLQDFPEEVYVVMTQSTYGDETFTEADVYTSIESLKEFLSRVEGKVPIAVYRLDHTLSAMVKVETEFIAERHESRLSVQLDH